ncbi:MAG: hypothetical protein IJE09_06265 [Oscillospiraceae bacterium]|nr:hypothetical protein [Oscillospiraceae bacterium]
MADKRVEIFIPRGADREDPNLFVGINGVNYLLPRGKKSMVPLTVAAEIERSGKAADIFYESVDGMKQAGN